jgi:mono/diheme cytochrome c family protein
MKKTTLLAYVLCVMMLVISCAVRKSEPLSGKRVDISDRRVANGQMLYHAYCQKCHPAGEAGLGPSVTAKPGFLTRFQARHGLGVMPAFKPDRLSRQDLKDIARYLRELNRL